MSSALLLRLSGTVGADARVMEQARAFARMLPGVPALQVCVSLDGTLAHIYAWTDASARNGAAALSPARLTKLSEWRGASAGERASYRFVVATDIEPGWEIEFNNWYQREHMPGLAAVPGNVRCARLRSVDSTPRYYACYDLQSPQVMERREWLAMRTTSWTTRIRPHFRNASRILFRTLLDERAPVFALT